MQCSVALTCSSHHQRRCWTMRILPFAVPSCVFAVLRGIRSERKGGRNQTKDSMGSAAREDEIRCRDRVTLPTLELCSFLRLDSPTHGTRRVTSVKSQSVDSTSVTSPRCAAPRLGASHLTCRVGKHSQQAAGHHAAAETERQTARSPTHRQHS